MLKVMEVETEWENCKAKPCEILLSVWGLQNGRLQYCVVKVIVALPAACTTEEAQCI